MSLLYKKREDRGYDVYVFSGRYKWTMLGGGGIAILALLTTSFLSYSHFASDHLILILIIITLGLVLLLALIVVVESWPFFKARAISGKRVVKKNSGTDIELWIEN